MYTPIDRFSFDRFTSRPLFGIHREPERETPVVGDADVLVVGGSQSGCAAAICAARHGVSVQLVERYGFLGGQSVYGSVTQWEKRAFINNLGAVATRGIAREMVDRIVAKGGSDGLWTTAPGCSEMRDGEEWLNVEALKLVLIEMCQEAGVEILLHTLATDVMLERPDGGLPVVRGAVFENKSGRFAISARVVVDATADLDLVWRAAGEDGCAMREPAERIAAGFYIWFGGVENEAFIDYVLRSGEQDGYPDPNRYPDKVRRHMAEDKLVLVRGFRAILEQARALGLMDPVDAALAGVRVPPLRELKVKYVGHARWASSLIGLRGLNLLDAWQVTDYEILRIKLENMMLPIVRLIPGWEACYLARTNMHVGGREGRYLRAVRMLSERDIFSPENETRPTPRDTVGRSGAHDPGKNRLAVAYALPYGMLVPERLDGLLCAARSVGAEPRVALDAHRGIMPTIVVGQAAGTAAALAVRTGVQPRDVNLGQLQALLRGDDVVLDVERVAFDFEIPRDKVR